MDQQLEREPTAPAKTGGPDGGRTSAKVVPALPLAGLLALFTAGFLGIINETIPAGLLPEISRGLGISESLAGQTITVYALATAFTAIPLNAALKRHGRRTVIVWALVAFALANGVVAFVGSFPAILVARFVAGVGAGLIWSNIWGFAARLVAEQLQGRAIAITMAGIPAALSLGLPAGTLLGHSAGWHATFGVAAAASIALIAWMYASLPDLPGQSAVEEGATTATILRTPGVRLILLVIAGYIVAHNIMYTYIDRLADAARVGGQTAAVLLTFGLAALLSIWATGLLIDPRHRGLIVVSTVVFAGASLVLGFSQQSPVVLYLGVGAWGLAFGGSATLFLTAAIRAARTDAIQSIVVTIFNLGIAAGGVLGGLLLAGFGVGAIPWVALGLMIPTATATILGDRHAFPPWPRGD